MRVRVLAVAARAPCRGASCGSARKPARSRVSSRRGRPTRGHCCLPDARCPRRVVAFASRLACHQQPKLPPGNHAATERASPLARPRACTRAYHFYHDHPPTHPSQPDSDCFLPAVAFQLYDSESRGAITPADVKYLLGASFVENGIAISDAAVRPPVLGAGGVTAGVVQRARGSLTLRLPDLKNGLVPACRPRCCFLYSFGLLPAHLPCVARHSVSPFLSDPLFLSLAGG